MSEPGPHHRTLFRRLAIAPPASLVLMLLVITLFGARLHKLLAETAGGIIGEIKDNLAVVGLVSGICVAGVWLLIGLKCLSEGRTDSHNE